MKIVLTLFLLATFSFALVDENIPTANTLESQKTDLIIKTNNGQTFSINADGKTGPAKLRKLQNEGDETEGAGDEEPVEVPEIDDDYLEDVQFAVQKYDALMDEPQTEGDFCMSKRLASQIYDLLNDYQAVAEEAVNEVSSDCASSGDDEGDRKLAKIGARRHKKHKHRHVRALAGKGTHRHHRHHRILKEESKADKVNKI
mgnify:CR=1 FL=1